MDNVGDSGNGCSPKFSFDRWEWLSVLSYVALGWMLVFVIKPLWQSMPVPVITWIVVGGISYMTESVFISRP